MPLLSDILNNNLAQQGQWQQQVNQYKTGLLGMVQNPVQSLNRLVQVMGNQTNQNSNLMDQAGWTPGSNSVLLDPKIKALARGLLADQGSQIGMAGTVGSPKMADMSYQIEHKPMTIEGGAAPLHDLAQSFGDDVYGKNALQYYGSGDPREAAILKTMAKVKGNPNAPVTIYRGVPDGVNTINSGDWVTLHPNVASDYGNVISQQVPASHVTAWPDSLMEFGYYPPK